MHMPNIIGFKGIYEFPWLGGEANRPELIPHNVEKAKGVLEKIFVKVIKPCLFDDSTS